MGHPTKAQRSGFCGEEESGEAPPAAEKASRFRGSGAIGGPEGAGNRNAATVYDMRYFAMDLAGERRGFAAT